MSVMEEDVQSILSSIVWEPFQGKTILITGGTGLIGKTLVYALIAAKIKTVLLLRSIKKGKKLFGDSCQYVEGTIEQLPHIDSPIDYVIHLAGPTESSSFVERPIETIDTIVGGIKNLLELAKEKKVHGFIFLSTMEVYGNPGKGYIVREEEIAGFDTRVPRNSYPISKILSEMLCTSYASEFGVPTKILRLTQTFGPGVEYHDNRIFAEFMRSAIERKSIVLHTEGMTERCYLYTADAVMAILIALVHGKTGEVYNVANPETYCSIREMAELVADMSHIPVEFQIDDVERGYANTLYINLDVSQIQALGWQPKTGLREMFSRMIRSQIGQ